MAKKVDITADITAIKDADLIKEMQDNQEKLRNLRFTKIAGKINPSEFRQARKNVARILTELRRRELANK